MSGGAGWCQIAFPDDASQMGHSSVRYARGLTIPCLESVVTAVRSTSSSALLARTIDTPQTTVQRHHAHKLGVGGLASHKPDMGRDGGSRTNHPSYTADLHHALGSSSGVVLGRKGKNVCQLARAAKESLRESACSYCSARKSVIMSSI